MIRPRSPAKSGPRGANLEQRSFLGCRADHSSSQPSILLCPGHVRTEQGAVGDPRDPHVCPISPTCLLTKVLLQEGQDGLHHDLLTFIRVQGPTSVTGEEFSNQVACHKGKVSLTPMNSTSKEREKPPIGGWRLSTGIKHLLCAKCCLCVSVTLPGTLSGKYLPL